MSGILTPAGLPLADRWRVRAAIGEATLAASVHNSQPWRFETGPDRVTIRLDGRDLPRVIDPDGRWAMASIGAAAANLEVALRCRLRRPVRLQVTAKRPLTPPGCPWWAVAEPLVVATWDPQPREPTPYERALHAAIPHRHAARGPLYENGTTALVEVARAAAKAASGPGAELRCIVPNPAAVAALLRLTGQAEARWQADPAYLAEIQRWTHPVGRRGIPPAARGPRDVASHLPQRDFAVTVDGHGAETRPAEQFEVTPTLLVIAAPTDTPTTWIRAGMLAETIALDATSRDLAVGFLAQAVELPELRRAAERELGPGTGTIQQILRVGRPAPGRPPAPAPRRSLRQVLRPIHCPAAALAAPDLRVIDVIGRVG